MDVLSNRLFEIRKVKNGRPAEWTFRQNVWEVYNFNEGYMPKVDLNGCHLQGPAPIRELWFSVPLRFRLLQLFMGSVIQLDYNFVSLHLLISFSSSLLVSPRLLLLASSVFVFVFGWYGCYGIGVAYLDSDIASPAEFELMVSLITFFTFITLIAFIALITFIGSQARNVWMKWETLKISSLKVNTRF